MTEQNIDREWYAIHLMGWHVKGRRPTCYYYDQKDRRQTTIRNWQPDWPNNGQIWMIVVKMRELGFLMTLYNDFEKKWFAKFTNEHGHRWEIQSDPCIAILLAAKSAFEELYEGDGNAILKLADLKGIAPNITGGLSSEDYIRKFRDLDG